MNRSTRVWVRRLTTVAIVAVILAAASIAVYRGRRSLGVPRLLSGDLISSQVRDLATDFRIEETDAGRLIFTLAAEQTIGDQFGWYEIEGVRLKLHRAEGEGPVLSCQAASFNVATREARLRGSVQVEFPGGALLTTDSGRFDNQSRSFVTDGGILYTDGLAVGRAGRAAYFLEDDRLLLSDSVVVRDQRGLLLTAPSVVYGRAEGRVTFPEGCRLVFGESELEAPAGTLKLDDDGGIDQLDLSGGVTARSTGGPDGAAVALRTERLQAQRESGGGWQVAATTSGPWIEVEFLGGRSFIHRQLTALSLRAVMGLEGLAGMRAGQGVCLREVPFAGAVRLAEAESARVWFESGSATDVELDEQVVLVAEGVTATGHRARVSSTSGIIMLHGHPVRPQRTTLRSERGRVEADHILRHDVDARIEARGSVQGELFDVRLLGDEVAEEPTSTHFAAGLLEVTEGGSAFRLREGARAWQGRRMLLADDIRYRHAAGRLEASGHVRTTFPASQIEGSEERQGDVMVVSRALEYDRADQRAVYRGMVRFSDPSYTLAASELEVVLDDFNRLSRIEARGAVDIEDLQNGWRMTGQTAVRDLATQMVSLTGAPAQLRDAKGNVVSGPSLTWDQASGTVTVAGGSETIYYPEETP